MGLRNWVSSLFVYLRELKGDGVRSQLGGGARGFGGWAKLRARGPFPFHNIVLTRPLQSCTQGVLWASETGFRHFLSVKTMSVGINMAIMSERACQVGCDR